MSYYSHDEEQWSALDSSAQHPCNPCSGDNDNNTGADAEVSSEIDQLSNELIVIRDSCNIRVSTTDTQVAVSLQAALQVAIAIVVNISIADSSRAERVTAELLERSQIRQTNRQRLIIVNSRDIEVTTVDTDVAISLQLLLQVLVALVAQLDIL
ncbi:MULTISPECIES: spore coat protein [Sporosarcina]|uniref:spore coat protein n=1 Tax=Sporosarcina TaxID=1569 RepID=UPI00129AC033|nr:MULTISPECIES: spore coat protein [Sporosarcina]GKV63995.1 spore coat protein X [Sporosarcina sp. NCCP-2331]GLB54776.1 spore coat protein X [Sporosarcina sp. NCCP-2378]